MEDNIVIIRILLPAFVSLVAVIWVYFKVLNTVDGVNGLSSGL